MDFWLDHADIENVLIEDAWCRGVCDRVGGIEVYRDFCRSPQRLYESADCTKVLSLSHQFFTAVGKRDLILMGKRFVLLIDGDEDPPQCAENGIYWYIDRRAKSTRSRSDVQHFFSEHAMCIGRPRNSKVIKNSLLTSVWLLNCKYLDDSAFAGHTSLRIASCPRVTTVGNHVFHECFEIVKILLPCAQFVGHGAFADAARLTSISLPKLTVLGTGAFLSTFELKKIIVKETMVTELKRRVPSRTQVTSQSLTNVFSSSI